MPLKILRFYTLLLVTLCCIALFIFGLVAKVTFFYTFIGPAIVLFYVAIKPNYYYDIIAVSMILLLTIMALIFSVTNALFNHEYGLAFIIPFVPIAALIIVLYCMDKLKREDELYS